MELISKLLLNAPPSTLLAVIAKVSLLTSLTVLIKPLNAIACVESHRLIFLRAQLKRQCVETRFLSTSSPIAMNLLIDSGMFSALNQ
jgi:hypothetical protein